MRWFWTCVFTAVIFGVVLLVSPVSAQGLDNLFKVDQAESTFQIGAPKEPEVSAILRPGDKAGVVVFELKLTIPPGANSYSQAKDFAKPTVITLTGIEGWTPLDESFIPTPKPKRSFDEVFGKDVEKLVGTTTFSRRYLAPEGTEIKGATFEGKIDFLLCDEGSCTPKLMKFSAKLMAEKKAEVSQQATAAPALNALLQASESTPSDVPGLVTNLESPPEDAPLPPTEAPSASAFTMGYGLTPQRNIDGKPTSDPVQLQFRMIPATPQNGEEVQIAITMQLFDGWNTYGLEQGAKQIETPTRIVTSDLQGLEAIGEWTPETPPEVHASEVSTANVHRDRVTWLRKFLVTDVEKIGVSGRITYQICKQSCLAPLPVPFSLGGLQDVTHVAQATVLDSPDLANVSSPDAGQEVPAEIDLFAVKTEGSIDSLAFALPLAFLGGLLLNIMPCVLPVLAIKILSLVQQAGESRSRILSLNLSYTAGVLLVFMLLAVVSAAIGWGGQFQNRTYVVLMSIIVFSMGLSLLGVFELPIPGLVPSANTHNEGLLAAFNTGIVATLLATPCTGPFMGVVIAFAAKQPTLINFLIFGTMGIGMSSPYLVAGFFPRVVDWLPRPGMWMVRFKQFAGFVLMGTVIWLMNTSLDVATHVPLLILLLGVALFLWMVGLATESGKALLGKPLAHAALLASPIIAYGIYDLRSTPESTTQVRMAELNNHGTSSAAPDDVAKMPWEPFSEARMTELRHQGTPMLIDFTADWCGVCKTNEMWALNRKRTVEFVRKNGIVPLVADYTKQDQEIRKWLERFGVQSVPLVVIFPADKTQDAIAISGPYTMDVIIQRLEKAVASVNTATAGSEQPQVTLLDSPSR